MKIALVPKMSKVEYDMYKNGQTYDEVIASYRNGKEDIAHIINSHNRQAELRDKLCNHFPKEDIIERNNFNKDVSRKYDIIISLGGDNHFNFVSHQVIDNMILGVNSDYLTSLGALTYHSVKDIEKVVKSIKKSNFKVEGWTRLEAVIEGTPTELATSEIFVGESENKQTSRYWIKLGKVKEEHKGSGLLISTGAGIGPGSFYHSAQNYAAGQAQLMGQYLKAKSKKARLERIVFGHVREPSYKHLFDIKKLRNFKLREGDELELFSLCDSKGELTPDCLESYDFTRPKHAVIRVADKPLKVVRGV